jgi:hypothetical protein
MIWETALNGSESAAAPVPLGSVRSNESEGGMDWNAPVAAAITGGAVVVAAVLGLRSAHREELSQRVRGAQEILDHLHAESSRREELQDYIDAQIAMLVTWVKPKRNWSDVILGAACALLGLFATAWSIDRGGWLWIVTPPGVVFLLAGVYGVAQGWPKVARDGKGQPVER